MKRLLLVLALLPALLVFGPAKAEPAGPPPFSDVVLTRPGRTAPASVPSGPVEWTIDVRPVEWGGYHIPSDELAWRTEDIERAARWWVDLSPITTTLEVTSTGTITVSFDALQDWPLLLGYDNPNDRLLTVFVVYNTGLHRTFAFDDRSASGLGFFDGPILVLTDHGYGANDVVDAHEMGHALYHLLDLYYDSNIQLDIMDTLMFEAYIQRFIGWQSLHSMGVDPINTYFPLVRN